MNTSKAVTALVLLAAHAQCANVDPDSKREIHFIEWSKDLFQEEQEGGPQSIIGGSEIVPGSRPYLVPIGTGDDYWFCGGSLISPHAVMTAAHCVIDPQVGGEWRPSAWVEFHRHSWFNNTGVNRVYINDLSQCDGDVIYHPNYNPYLPWENDVAIIFLPTAIEDIIPVMLNEDPKVPESGAPLDVTGWGRFIKGLPDTSDVPQAVTLDYVTNEACTRKPYRWHPEYVIQQPHLCAIASGKSTCSGDSGGPVTLGLPESKGGGPVSPPVQVGIVSFGRNTCQDDRFPSVFTRVSEVADWVKSTVCARTGELCKGSKAAKKSKKYPDNCLKVPTDAPTAAGLTSSPTITSHPTTPIPTYFPTASWPTWIPTKAPMSKAGKDEGFFE